MGWLDNLQSNPIGTIAGAGAGAALGPLGIIAGGSIANGGMSGLTDALTGDAATQRAIQAQQAATTAANATSKDVYGQQTAALQPYQAAGTQALSQMSDPNLSRSFTMNDFQSSPGYQFQMDQGNQAIQRSAAAKGLLGSTGTMKTMDQYSQGLANQDYQTALGNFKSDQNQRFGQLSSLANVGQNANQQFVGAAGNYGNQVSNNTVGMGNATAAANIGEANRMSGLIGGGITGGSTILSRMV